MQWFRHYHGLCTDPKLHRIARACGVSRAVVIAAWCAVLEAASAAENRGCIGDMDAVELGFMVDIKPHSAAKVMAAFVAAGMLDHQGNVGAWAKRQRDSDDAAERKRRQRERTHQDRPGNGSDDTRGGERKNGERPRNANPLSDHETDPSCHGTNPTVDQIQTQSQKKEDSPPAAAESAPRAHAREAVPEEAGAAAPAAAAEEPANLAEFCERARQIDGASPATTTRTVRAWVRQHDVGRVEIACDKGLREARTKLLNFTEAVLEGRRDKREAVLAVARMQATAPAEEPAWKTAERMTLETIARMNGNAEQFPDACNSLPF